MKEEDKGFKMVYNKDDDESCGITNFIIAKFSQNLLANLIFQEKDTRYLRKVGSNLLYVYSKFHDMCFIKCRYTLKRL